MPSFTFTSPEGQKYTVNGPDGATQEQAFAILQGQIGKAKPPASPSMAEGLVRSASRGVPILGGLLNKADAATDAALAPALNRFFPEKDQLKGATFGDRYKEALKTQEGEDEGFAREHPYLDTGAEIAGGIAATGGAAMTGVGAKALGLTAKTLPGMVGQGIVSGGVIGGLDSATRGGDPTEGALYGALGGAAGPVVGKIAGEVAAPLTRVVRGLRDPEAEAARRVAGALDRDIKTGSNGLSPQEFSDARRGGQPVTLMEAGGDTTRALARSAANTSPEARGIIERTTSDRFGSQGDRLTGWLNSTFNYPNADETSNALKNIGRTVNKPAYAKAYAKGAGGVWTDELAQASQAPVVQEAIRKTMFDAKNEAAKMGFPAPQNPFRADKDGRIFLGKDSNGRDLIPSLHFWDYVKRNLDKGGRDAQEWAKSIRDHLDEHIPEYGEARAGAARFFGAQDALEAGQKAVTSRMGNRDIASGLSKFSPAERKLFQDGFVDTFVKQIREMPDRRNALNGIATSPAARERLMMALGPQKAKELETFLRVEGVMDRARTNLGNSTTARQLAELGLAGGYNLYEGHGGVSTDPTVLAQTAAIYGALRGSRALGSHIDDRVVKRVAELLTSSNIKDIDKGVKLISRNATMFKAIRAADQAVGAAATRGAVSGADANSQDARNRRGNVTVD